MYINIHTHNFVYVYTYMYNFCQLSLCKAGGGEEYLEADKSKFLWKIEAKLR